MREWRCRPALMAAQRHPHLVENERAGALRARLGRPAVPAQHGARAAAAVDHEDRALAGVAIELPHSRRKAIRENASIAGRQLRPQVDDFDRGRRAGEPLGQGDRPIDAILRPPKRFH